MTVHSILVRAALSLAAFKLSSADVLGIHQSPTVYQAVSSKVSAFEARLSEMELENKQKLSARKVEFDKKLQAQREANTVMAASNSDLAREVEDIRTRTVQLRAHAKELQEDNAKWKEDYAALQSNFSTVLELTSNSLAGMDTDAAAPELKILNDLSAEDEKHAAAMGYASRFNEIVSNRRVSLLATNTEGVENPRSILKVLDAGIQDMSEEFNRNQASLDAQYQTLFDAEKSRHEGLVAEKQTLAASQQELLQLEARLQAAVQKLETVNRGLAEKGAAIRMYAQRLGIRAMPQHGVAQAAVQAHTVKPTTQPEFAQAAHEASSGEQEVVSLRGGSDSERSTKGALMALLTRR